MKELVVRMIYVEMLGQDASFAYIKAVELCASTSIAQKKAGYLAGIQCNTFLYVSVLILSNIYPTLFSLFAQPHCVCHRHMNSALC